MRRYILFLLVDIENKIILSMWNNNFMSRYIFFFFLLVDFKIKLFYIWLTDWTVGSHTIYATLIHTDDDVW